MKDHFPLLASLLFIASIVVTLPVEATDLTEAQLVANAQSLSKTGKTLPVDIALKFPLEIQRLRNDTGINVLVDLAHACNFVGLWSVPGALNANGFRACGSQATLDTVLAPGKPVRIRVPVDGRRPFAWWPNARYNVVMTYQSGPDDQVYLPEEQEALREFVMSGGGLIIMGAGRSFDKSRQEEWSLNKLAKQFGAAFDARTDMLEGKRLPTFAVSTEWETVVKGEAGLPLAARRTMGKGRVVMISAQSMIYGNRRNEPREVVNRKNTLLRESVLWAAEGTEPVGGEPRLPTPAGGGGGIYPELELQVGNVITYYAKNQKEELIKTVKEDLPRVQKQIEEWLPSVPSEDLMYLVLSAGGGGGWAVNIYEPKEVGIISLQPLGFLSVFAHELAHTMAGPPNAKGETAGNWPQGNRGESHAGWFQGKIMVQETGRNPVKDLNRLFDFDKDGDALDLAADPTELREKWGKGREWTKIWWVWQKLDDRYGPTWYPRWRWVQYTRWQDTPKRKLTWDEMVEDMSIAVGEDLFPFFGKIGTTLEKSRFSRAEFNGREIELPVAPLEVTPAGDARLEAIGDYRTPIEVR